MKSLTLLLALGLASSDKLDRTYLPPPGSKFAGGSPGSIQVPLELPKETYSTTLRPVSGQTKDRLSPGDSRLTVGIDRGTGIPNIPIGSQDLRNVTPRPEAPITPFQDIHKLPSTTTSYAFTQTTTFPSEGVETTVSSGLFNDFQQQVPGLPNYPQLSQGQLSNHFHPGYGQRTDQSSGQHLGFNPAIGPNIQAPGFGSQSPIPGGQTFVEHSGYNQGLNQYQQALRPSSTIPPTSDVSIQPGLVPQSPDQNQLTNYLGVQPPRQFIGQQNTFPDVHSSQVTQQNYQSGSPQYGDNSHNIQGTTKGSNIPGQLGGQRPISVGSNIPSTISPHGITPTYQPGASKYRTDLGNIQGDITPVSNIPQQFGVQRPTLAGQQLPSTIFPQSPQGNTQYNTDVGNIQSSVTEGSSRPQQIDNQQPPQIFGQHGSLPSTVTPQGLPSSYQSSSQYGTTPVPNISQTGTLLGHQITALQGGQPGTQLSHDVTLQPHLYPTPKPGDLGVSNGSSQNIYLPDSTSTSSILPPGYPNQSIFPSTLPSIFPSHETTTSVNAYSSTTSPYPENSQGNISPIIPGSRPERPQAEFDRNAVIVNYENVLTPEGYAYNFDTSNGIHADESGTANDGVKAKGSYSYTGDDGKIYSVMYSADENGFQPHGDHLPTPPPIPEAIQRVIDQAIKDKEAGISHDGFYDEDKYGHKKYQGLKNRRPQTQDRIVINGADIPDEEETEFHVSGNKKGSQGGRRKPATEQQIRGGHTKDGKRKRPTGRVPPLRRPSNKVTEKNVYKDAYNKEAQQIPSQQQTVSTGNNYYKHRPMTTSRKPFLPGSSMSNYLDSQDEDNDEIQDEIDNFENDATFNENNRRLPPHRLPTKTTDTKYIRYDNKLQDSLGESVIRDRPGIPQGSKRPAVMKYIEDSDDRNNQRLNGKGPLPSNKLPPSSTTTSYVKSEDYSDDVQQNPNQTDTVKETTSLRPTGFKRPESPETTNIDIISGRPRLPENQIPQRYDEHREDNYDHKDRRPTSAQHPGIVSNSYQSQEPSDEVSGYQYNVPQNKFDQSEKNGFPTRFPEVVSVTSTKRPYETSVRKTTIQPFMTPNVSRDNDESYDDNVDQRLPSRKPSKPSTAKTTSTPVTTREDYDDDFETDGPEYDESEMDTDQEIDDESNAPTRIRPGKPGTTLYNSTRRPNYGQSRPTTTGPEYDQGYSADKKDIRDQKRPVRPGQMRNKHYNVEGNERPEERPEKRTKLPMTHAYNLVSSTTPMPTQSSTRFDGSYPQYPSTYQTTDDSRTTINDSDGLVAPEFVTSRPGTSSRLPGTDIGDKITVPGFSTSRPGISEAPGRSSSRPVTDYSESTTIQEPAIIRSGFSEIHPGRPTSAPIRGYDSSVAPETSGASSTTTRPSTITDYDRTVSPGFPTTKSGSIFSGRPGIQSQNIPSTTYRPNYNLADITTQTDSQSRPAIKVDRYGRPIYQPGTGVIGSATYRPEYSITPSQESGTPSDRTYQSYTPGGSQTLKPDEQRFGKPENGTPDEINISQEPNKFGFTQHQGAFPSYPENYMGHPSTERVIGEDFSGPKQPQKFDPETGYHY